MHAGLETIDPDLSASLIGRKEGKLQACRTLLKKDIAQEAPPQSSKPEQIKHARHPEATSGIGSTVQSLILEGDLIIGVVRARQSAFWSNAAPATCADPPAP